MDNEKRLCKYCGKTLRSIGLDRANGKTDHSDWSKRKYHKKCWKQLDNIKYCQNLIKQYADEEAKW
jgi:hypothetical protein